MFLPAREKKMQRFALRNRYKTSIPDKKPLFYHRDGSWGTLGNPTRGRHAIALYKTYAQAKRGINRMVAKALWSLDTAEIVRFVLVPNSSPPLWEPESTS